MTTIALFGAAGKMGRRITARLRGTEYSMLYVEAGEAGLTALAQDGISPTPWDEAAREADVLILAVPDVLVGRVAHEIAPELKPGAMVICLDPAAPAAGHLPQRRDVSYFVVHPSHPPIFNDEVDPEARCDYFGAVKAKQHIVCALVQGIEEDYRRGEEIARRMFAPVMNAHRVTVEQMALLEPALSETLAATCLTVIREGMDEVVRRGVPAAAARDFLLGHINIELAIVFGEVDSPFSDGALTAITRAREEIFRPDWKKIFEPEEVSRSVEAITHG